MKMYSNFFQFSKKVLSMKGAETNVLIYVLLGSILGVGLLLALTYMKEPGRNDMHASGNDSMGPAVSASLPLSGFISVAKEKISTSNHKMQVMAWIYPGPSGCAASKEYRDGRRIDVLKPEYFSVVDNGNLEFLTEEKVGCNGYSRENAADLAKYSKKQFVTISSSYSGNMVSFLHKANSDPKIIADLVQFVRDNDFEGIELDFEDFGSWKNEDYDLYKKFVKNLGDALHKNQKQLMIVGPATANAEQEAWFVWRYNDFVALPVDMIIIMTYDYQYDQGPGSPIAPFEWVDAAISLALSKFPDKSRLGAGIPSYGYVGQIGTQKIKLLSYHQVMQETGGRKAERDPHSGELLYKRNTAHYYYQDGISMTQKRERIAKHGLAAVSVWSLGGNPWFSK